MEKRYIRKLLVIGVLFLFLGASVTLGSAKGAWSDNFDSYANDQYLEDGSAGDGYWAGWGIPPDPTCGGYVRDDKFRSSPYSVEIALTTDLVQQYTDIASGVWEYKAWQYIPTDFTGDTYFILLSDYDGTGTEPGCVWTVQLKFSGGIIESQWAGQTMSYQTGAWKLIKCVIDLDTDWLEIYYDGTLLAEHAWTDTVNAGSGYGTLKLVAVDLFSDTGSIVYYDDLSLAPPSTELTCDAHGPYEGVVDEVISFTGSAEGGTSPYTWAWAFGDGATSTEQNPTHAYTSAGVFNVTLTVTDSAAATASAETTATITEPVPTIEIGNATGGLFKVKATIKNTGDAAAANVNWSIALDGGFILLGKSSTGTVASIAAGGTATITSKMIIGFGKPTITITAGTATKEVPATVLLFYIKI